jgi:hypothetical protein
LSEAWRAEPVPPEALALFMDDPVQYGPTTTNTGLDTSPKTLAEAKKSLWNLERTFKLVQHAKAVVAASDHPKQYGWPTFQIEWNTLFKDRINRILVAAYKAKPKTYKESAQEALTRVENEIQAAQKRAQGRAIWEWVSEFLIYILELMQISSLLQKHEQRLQLASLKQQECREKGDKEGERCWGFLLYSVAALDIEGASDEEDGDYSINGGPVKLVSDVSFRRVEFRSLFHIMDGIREKEPEKWSSVGRKFSKRVLSTKIAERQPSPHLSTTFLKPSFQLKHPANEVSKTLDIFNAQLTQWVSIAC